ncbi:MAG: DNA mismatch repair endonuclease MutL [Dehalococcoidales bacterium]|nr:DNA mismatch repair endonuclease MutL [Dehalococcoidales bacterium]
MPIKVLEPKVISQIAAGEVVERPASVVKELVENSLDAGATQISVEVKGGGVSLIRVVDNGSGIPADEAELAFGRHATSKITNLDDLESILSLGFRGEALASIAAVAEVELTTCAAGEATGTYLALKGGEITGRGRRGRSPGTTIAVSGLFRQVPARLKFLKSAATEASHIANIVSRYALAFPEVRFSLSLDGRTTLRTPGSSQLADSVAEVYGLEVAQSMLEIKAPGWDSGGGGSALTVSGLVGSPKISRASRDYISIFVNRRWVRHRALAWAVEEAYHGLLMTGKHPVAVINLGLPPREVDANVHPTKTEVRFRGEAAVFGAVQRAVRQTLVEMAPVPRISEVAGRPAPTSFAAPPPILWPQAVGGGRVAPPPSPEVSPTPALTLPVLRVVGQLLSSYIIAEGPDGLYLIDQHAAHERILFEQIMEKRARREVEVQTLLEATPFEVTPHQAEALESHLEKLGEFGFSIEPFGERTFLVRSVPASLAGGDWLGVIREILDAGSGQGWEEKMVALLACHSAVRAGQVLTDDEMREMVRQLEQVSLPNTCPHGRPTLIRLTREQLEREFGRS